MSNLGGLEILTILVIALVVLGPTKLPEAARSVGKAVNELRRISGGFQREMRDAMNEMNDATIEAEARAKGAHHPPPRAAGRWPGRSLAHGWRATEPGCRARRGIRRGAWHRSGPLPGAVVGSDAHHR